MKEFSPELFAHIRRLQVQTTRAVNDLFAGAYHSAFKGRGMEFEEVREYQEGDEIRTIDWNVTARMNHPYVKLYREERELTVMLLVDISASSRFGTVGRSKSEVIAEIGAILALSAIKNDDKVGLILFTSRVEKYIPPKKGIRHVIRVIRELLAYSPLETGTDLKGALGFLGKVRRRPCVCFILSDFLCGGYDREAMITSQRHDVIAVAINDPAEEHFPPLGLVRLQDLETGKITAIDSSESSVREDLSARAKKQLDISKKLMRKVGAAYVPIRTDQSYIEPLRKFFKLRERRP